MKTQQEYTTFCKQTTLNDFGITMMELPNINILEQNTYVQTKIIEW